MASRILQQFLFSFLKKFVKLSLVVDLVEAIQAAVTDQGVTYTAVAFGTSGNSITVTLADGAGLDTPVSAGSEVVSVSGSAITVYIEDGATTQGQVKSAIEASAAASALVTVAVASSSTEVDAAAAVALSGGIDGVASFYGPGVQAVTRSGVGEYTIVLQDKFHRFMGAHSEFMAATAVDLIPQIKSYDQATKTLIIRLNKGATPTEVKAESVLCVEINFNDSTVEK